MKSQFNVQQHSPGATEKPTFTHLEFPHVQEGQVVPQDQASPEDQGVLVLPSTQLDPERHQGRQEGLVVKCYQELSAF